MAEIVRRPVLLGDDLWVDAVVGYRAWHVTIDRGVATMTAAVAKEWVWPKASPLKACCTPLEPIGRYLAARIGDHPAPRSGCKCGIWAFDSPDKVAEVFHDRVYLLGEVALWGKIKVHRLGYRAEYAQPIAVYEPSGTWPGRFWEAARIQASIVARQYEVPLVQRPAPEIILP